MSSYICLKIWSISASSAFILWHLILYNIQLLSIIDFLRIECRLTIIIIFGFVNDKKLVGILTNRDIRFETNLNLRVSDRMTSKNLVTVEKGTTLEKAKIVLQKYRIEKLLVVDKAGKLTGLITVNKQWDVFLF